MTGLELGAALGVGVLVFVVAMAGLALALAARSPRRAVDTVAARYGGAVQAFTRRAGRIRCTLRGTHQDRAFVFQWGPTDEGGEPAAALSITPRRPLALEWLVVAPADALPEALATFAREEAGPGVEVGDLAVVGAPRDAAEALGASGRVRRTIEALAEQVPVRLGLTPDQVTWRVPEDALPRDGAPLIASVERLSGLVETLGLLTGELEDVAPASDRASAPAPAAP